MYTLCGQMMLFSCVHLLSAGGEAATFLTGKLGEGDFFEKKIRGQVVFLSKKGDKTFLMKKKRQEVCLK